MVAAAEQRALNHRVGEERGLLVEAWQARDALAAEAYVRQHESSVTGPVVHCKRWQYSCSQ